MEHKFKVGDRVLVPWGFKPEVVGEIVEVWGDPPQHVLFGDEDEDAEPVILLLSPSVVSVG